MVKKKTYHNGATTSKGRRILASREAKMIERDAKQILMVYGNRTSQIVKDVCNDLYVLKRMECIRFSRLNDNLRPFEAHGGEVELERLCKKAGEASLFLVASSSKKRKHNLVFGRMFDGALYDAVEVGCADDENDIKLMKDFKEKSEVGSGNKPIVVFAGELFETDDFLKQFKGTMLDFFKGTSAKSINLAGVDRVVSFTVVSDNNAKTNKIMFRQYRIRFKKSGTKFPNVSLSEMGPSLTLTPRRFKRAPIDIAKAALIAVKDQTHLNPKSIKNVERDEIRGTIGKVYIPRQDISTMALAKMKGSKRKLVEANENDDEVN